MTDDEQTDVDLHGKWFFAYRKGYVKALIDILGFFESIEWRGKKDAIEMLRAAAQKPDTLMTYGSRCVLKCIKPTEFDKKKRKPIKYELMDYGWRPSQRSKDEAENI